MYVCVYVCYVCVCVCACVPSLEYDKLCMLSLWAFSLVIIFPSLVSYTYSCRHVLIADQVHTNTDGHNIDTSKKSYLAWQDVCKILRHRIYLVKILSNNLTRSYDRFFVGYVLLSFH